jgi:Tol biopolymer transport system component/DNA-binding winged helix-turn-helix (wHTH) protein
MSEQIKHFYEFGPFRLDIGQRILLRDGKHVPLPPKALETLVALVESGGHILDKDDLLKRIWPDTFVEEVNLAKKVSDLRKVLGKESGQYIETIPKRGYRFVANVTEVRSADVEASSEPVLNPTPEFAPDYARDDKAAEWADESGSLRAPAVGSSTASVTARQRLLGFLFVIGLAGCAVLVIIMIGPRLKSADAAFRVLPFTSFPGSESHPSFSPDASRVAFAWGGEEGDNQDIYVKLIGVEQPLRLTSNAATDSHPVWYPDGSQIVFFRHSLEGSGFYSVAALGGPERKLIDVSTYKNPTLGSSNYYSPNGELLAVADRYSQDEPFSIFLVSISTGEKQQLTFPPAGTVGDSYPGFSPDGKTLAFIRSSSQATGDLHLVAVTGGEPRRLTFDNTSIVGHTWTADARKIVFSSRRGSSIYNLWRTSVSEGAPERLPNVGQSVISPTISRDGNRLAYTQHSDDLNIWRLQLDPSGRGGVSKRIVSSTLSDSSPDYSPDGQRIVFASNRSGGFGIWVCNNDGSNPMHLVDRGPSLTGTPRWSPDGRWIAFDSRTTNSDQKGNADIYIVSANGGQPQQLTSEPSEDVAPSWSRDGQWIYFGSTRSGSMQIWKIPTKGGEAIQVTKQGGFEAFESIDGRILYYAKGRLVPGIWQIPVAGGVETQLLDHNKAGYWRAWAIGEKGIHFATGNVPSHPIIEFFHFVSRKVTRVSTLDGHLSRFEPGLVVSPDRQELLFTQTDRSGGDIMLVEDYR